MTAEPDEEHHMTPQRLGLCGLTLAVAMVAEAAAQTGYQKPPQAVQDVLNAPPPPDASVSPTGETVLFLRSDRYPPIAEVAEPTLRLAGLRINPRTNGPARAARITGLKSFDVASGRDDELAVPPRCGRPVWSPDGKRYAITSTTGSGIDLLVCDLAAIRAERVDVGVQVNAVIPGAIDWLPGSNKLLVRTVPANRPAAPAAPAAPTGPVVQETSGKAGPSRTFQDMLQNPHDEALFKYYATSQLVLVDVPSKTVTPVGKPGIITAVDPSPDGKLLLVTTVKKPFSYLLPYMSFPQTVEVINTETGKTVLTVADRPLADKVPIDGVATGRRAVRWVPTVPSALVWAEALDGGDPKAKVPHRDALFLLELGANDGPKQVLKLQHRFAGLDFFPDGYTALVRDYDRDRKWGRTFVATLDPTKPAEPAVLFERSIQDRYNDPGAPVMKLQPNGHAVVRTVGKGDDLAIFLSGPGASPKGDRPFLDRFTLKTKKSERLFQCAEGKYETVSAILNDAGTKLLVHRESPTEPPNYYLRDASGEKKLTDYADPAPELRKATKQLVTTKRSDGVAITFTLHLPPGYKDGTKLPAVFYAYPVEFASAADAGQVTGSPHRFTAVSGYSHLFFLLQGYAVMDVSMPIVGPPDRANDTFVDQLNMNAKAAIDKANELGVIDPNRVGVMGHSYGAFMTANLLAHSDLFRAGIARSGAYNRTLTPFGFQNEPRTFWDAPDVYGKMSPFFHANKIDEPLLLIHGAADDNPGTFPVQSERLYAAVRGHGGTCRLVMLPHEAHGYVARETTEHVLSEQIAWFDRYVKKAGPRQSKGGK